MGGAGPAVDRRRSPGHAPAMPRIVDGLPAEDVQAALAAAGINTTVTVPADDPLDTEERGLPALLRLSPHYYNTEAELDRAVEVVAGL